VVGTTRSAWERVRASARGEPGCLRPWAKKGGERPGKKENPFSFYFSTKTAQKNVILNK
jgi:hypothetical protein